MLYNWVYDNKAFVHIFHPQFQLLLLNCATQGEALNKIKSLVFYYKPKYDCCMRDYPFNDNLSSCTNLFGKWKGRTWRSKVSLHENPIPWSGWDLIESFPKSPTITQIRDTNTNNCDNIEFHHPQKHTQRVSCSCNEKWRKEWAFPIHGHHNGSKLSYSLKLANNRKKKHLSFGIVYLHKSCKGGRWEVEFDNNKKDDLNNNNSLYTICMIGMLESSR
jgi:hypothetical protein